MLNTLPSSPLVLPPSPNFVLSPEEVPEVLSPDIGGLHPRLRGAQPLNRNALRHGLYAHRNPTPLTNFLNTFQLALPRLESIPNILEEAVLSLRQEMARIFASQPQTGNLRLLLAHQRPILHLMGLFIRTQKLLARQRQPQQLLQLVAAHPLDLIHLDFRSNGITRDADSFREKIKLSDFNSLPAPSQLFLTPHQCQLLEPLLPSLKSSPPRFGEGPGMRSRGRPPADPLPLLDAIFWKLAHHARWQDLPLDSPPMLTCRRYYTRLYWSGRLSTLLSALFKDFRSCAETDLSSLVSRGCLTFSGTRLILQSNLEESWQMRTALLFMQQGWQALRRLHAPSMSPTELKNGLLFHRN